MSCRSNNTVAGTRGFHGMMEFTGEEFALKLAMSLRSVGFVLAKGFLRILIPCVTVNKIF